MKFHIIDLLWHPVNGILVDLNNNNYSKTIEEMLDFKDILKDNLKDFKYDLEVDKWEEIFE